jgi:methylthioribose-1-phosphate isomerase
MSKGEVDMVITGADRVAMNGDAANKIGTLEKAICAKQYNIPFYIAVPYSTIDPNAQTGADIPIEERNGEEVSHISGKADTGSRSNIRISNPGSDIRNVAFDVTPADLITGFITPNGLIPPHGIKQVISNQPPAHRGLRPGG